MILAIQILHVLVAIFLVLVILLQAGKGAGMGAAFGGAGSQTVFGGRGAQTFLGRLTTIAAALFFITSLTLSYASSVAARSVLEGESAPAPAAATDTGAAPAEAGGAPAPAPAPPEGDAAPEAAPQ